MELPRFLAQAQLREADDPRRYDLDQHEDAEEGRLVGGDESARFPEHSLEGVLFGQFRSPSPELCHRRRHFPSETAVVYLQTIFAFPLQTLSSVKRGAPDAKEKSTS